MQYLKISGVLLLMRKKWLTTVFISTLGFLSLSIKAVEGDSNFCTLPFEQQIPNSYFSSVKTAASYFPVLCKLQLKFKEQRIRTTLNVRPAFFSIFRRPEKRTYVVRINNKENFLGITLDEVPYKARTGIFGHEFSHILDFHHKNTFGIIHTGLRYIFPGSRSRYEKKIDELTIRRGLGEELLAWKLFLYHESSAEDIYLKSKRVIYYTPSEIDSLLQIHRDTLNY